VRTFEGKTPVVEILVALDPEMILRDAVALKHRIIDAVRLEYSGAHVVVHSAVAE